MSLKINLVYTRLYTGLLGEFRYNTGVVKMDIKIGDRFGLLTIVGEYTVSFKGVKKIYYKCICDCGSTGLERRRDYLVGHKNRDFSCGCNHSMKTNLGKKNINWRGHGDISGNQFGMIKHSAKFRNIEFNLTIEQIWELFLQQERRCVLTGLPLEFSESRRTGKVTTASLDRIDSTKPYTINNVQWIHKDVNIMKHDYSEEYFLELCERVVNTRLAA